jgi:putative FmdB family regulatory protein
VPTYEYFCKDCESDFEKTQGFSDPPVSTCPICQSNNIKKVFGSVGIVLKGSGFYRTDSRASNGKKHKDTAEVTKNADKSEAVSKTVESKESSDKTKATSFASAANT